MNGHATPKSSLTFEESIALLDEKSLSDIESDSGRAELEHRFTKQQREWANAARTAIGGLKSMSCWSTVLRVGFFLLPSFVQSRISRADGQRPRNEKLGPTAYLDGMRGLAAFFVFFCHYFYTCFVVAEGWGFGDDNYQILKLPFFRLLYAGPPMVCVFFIISGYALSLKPLRQARAKQWDGFATTMASFIFRRAIRLFLPTAISTFMVIILIRLGAYEWTRDIAYDQEYMKNIQEQHAMDRMETFSAQFVDWSWNMFNFIHIWDWAKFGGSTGYDVHLWTIPVEYRASMLLFLTLIGGARLRPRLRLFFLSGVMWFTYRSDRWDMILFYFGMLYAELDLIRGAHTNPATTAALPTSNEPTITLIGKSEKNSNFHSPRSRRMKSTGWVLLSVLALFFMSQPDVGSEATPGWVWLSTWIPEWWEDKYRYWQCVGSVLFVLCVRHSPSWQRVFNTPVVQYLGKISYSIYLMHGPVLHTVGYSIERWAWGITGTEGYNYNFGFMLAAVFVIPAVVWAADVFWRAVDAPVVRFTKWFETKCIVSE